MVGKNKGVGVGYIIQQVQSRTGYIDNTKHGNAGSDNEQCSRGVGGLGEYV